MSGLYPETKIFSFVSLMMLAPPEELDLNEPSVHIINVLLCVIHSQSNSLLRMLKFSIHIFSYLGIVPMNCSKVRINGDDDFSYSICGEY